MTKYILIHFFMYIRLQISFFIIFRFINNYVKKLLKLFEQIFIFIVVFGELSI